MKSQSKTIQENARLSAKEIILMSNLYLDKHYPHNFLTLEDIAVLLDVSKATAINVTREMDRKGLIKKVKGYITFYYPIRDKDLRIMVLEKVGFSR